MRLCDADVWPWVAFWPKGRKTPTVLDRLSVLKPTDATLASGPGVATFGGVNSKDLDARARKRIERTTRLMVSYLDKLTGRMHQRMFPSDDPLKAAGEAARAKVQELHDVAKRLADESPWNCGRLTSDEPDAP
jgi:hypothetical protein